MQGKHRRRKCRHCKEWFNPDPRSRFHQKYCSKPDCRKASKAVSQKRWYSKPANQKYWSGAEQVERVRAWRKANPKYWRGKGLEQQGTLQDKMEKHGDGCY